MQTPEAVVEEYGRQGIVDTKKGILATTIGWIHAKVWITVQSHPTRAILIIFAKPVPKDANNGKRERITATVTGTWTPRLDSTIHK